CVCVCVWFPVFSICIIFSLSAYRFEGEPLLLRCSFMDGLIRRFHLTTDNGYKFGIIHANGTVPDPSGIGGRLRFEGRGLWLLPSQQSDTGIYTCFLRNSTFCAKANVSLTVYPTERPNLDMMSYSVPSVQPGQNVKIICPANDFNRTEHPQWFRDYSLFALPVGRGRYASERDMALTIRNFSSADAGMYTCRVIVRVFNSLYRITRIFRIHTTGTHLKIMCLICFFCFCVTWGHIVSSLSILYFISPANNTIYRSQLGSSLVMRCRASTGDPSAETAQVTWLVRGQSVEDSFLSARAFQELRRPTASYVEASLVVLEVREEDTEVEFKCVAQTSSGLQEVFAQIKLADSVSVWMVVAVICSSFCLLVVSVFLYLLLKPRQQKQRDYFLARQDSTF
uniref:Ig-like domain-containing protein n=1 Tax=Denticeps clupeoides TaxID=299321 RepID=A0AAY4BQX9_9TELE